ncbi:CMRF35-like molecule 5 [Talpa occidentalis]|uniref:CMRF35-like molecule 5 n=1 Tax=Talpa occidentalis TaxID=50954 RepID=UPI00188E00D8|nr:CMRF35-like molecule 5 [Talpa occidentalis]
MDVCFPGTSAVTGPGTVRGWERGSLTVRCRYGRGYETYVKWWCRGAPWSSCNILVRTTGSEQEVKNDRVSIRDNQRYRTITVTMEALTRGDADTYWCGVERDRLPDFGAQVKVTVDPATTPNTTTTTSAANTTTSTAPVTPEEGKDSPTITGSREMFTRVLLLLAMPVLLVLTAASLLAWRLVRGLAELRDRAEAALSSRTCWTDPVSCPSPAASIPGPAPLTWGHEQKQGREQTQRQKGAVLVVRSSRGQPDSREGLSCYPRLGV